MTTAECQCRRCTEARCNANPLPKEEMLFGGIDGRLIRMFLCAICGNKRCPHASHHVHPCTGSNDAGQPGSDYV